MVRNPAARSVARIIVALGILLSMLLAGGAPSDFANGTSFVDETSSSSAR